MGQQQSAEKERGVNPKQPTSQQQSQQSQTDQAKRVNRKVSVHGLVSTSRGSAVGPSPTKDIATAQTTPAHVEKQGLQQYLQSVSPDSTVRNQRVERSTSRARKTENAEHKPTPVKSEPVSVPQPSGPMDVPVSKSRQDDYDEKAFDNKPAAAYADRRYTPISQLRPPRLPLPIADVPIPESPTLMPVDKGNADVPIFETDEPLSVVEPQIRRRSSVMSETAHEEEEIDEELQPYATDPTSRTVPTPIEWKHSTGKVYVTGTFANWEKKYRLHRKKSGDGMSTTINLPPGTHHIMFIVDNQMITNPDMPTAVDLNNVLVNYIEIALQDTYKARRESSQATGKPIPQTTPSTEEQPEEPEVDESTYDSERDEPRREEILLGDFRQIIPNSLIDIDCSDEDPKYQLAANIIGDFGGPPTLPMFLNRSILNGVLPLKDDASVLPLPNHTVLNHLMTSSVRNGVLSTSVTTRYRKKYVTTISFKPVPKFGAQVQAQTAAVQG